ncbi:hypothetical protein [Nocardia vinacea]|uniref:hypothetical protein n=1 Tax=Nocardia vinacea TaxID=96468 RepID=UPI0002EC62AB|nr:hypothetical protein [Nocardia vinacea]
MPTGGVVEFVLVPLVLALPAADNGLADYPTAPRSLALPDWAALTRLADALVAASRDNYQGWGDVVVFAACTATRIGEVSGCRVRDIDTDQWIWRLRRQTSPGPGGLKDKGTKGKRSRRIPIIEDIRPLVLQRIQAANRDPDARLFVGPAA